MTNPDSTSNEWNADVARVAQELSTRLRARGIEIHDSDSPDDVELLLESVEAFEEAVESQGGDLMVDEPPARGSAQPDDPHFLLPTRSADESVSRYVNRLNAATAAVRAHRPHA
jgi:hypothetical protein